jgi:hypothetical protein
MGCLGYVTNSLTRKSQIIQNAADDKGLVTKTQRMNGVQLQCVHSHLPFLNSKNLVSQNKADYMQLIWLHYLSKMQGREALWITISIQQNIFLGPGPYLY